ncbi:MAG TPA: hypothetical protein VFE61_11855 [Candidatus Sulfotelmatobacter sp.]|nr:hypothetical protein [Candidatus Sulfotelmatobacter sp.]
MRRLHFVGLQSVLAIIFLWSSFGCGGHPPAGQSQSPARVNLTPSSNASVQLGATFNFTASAQNAAGNNVAATFTFASSNTSILNIASNGVACAGIWDASFTTCTPGGIGPVQVTASTQGATSTPTWVFVHPPIDNITVSGVLLDNLPIQEPCLSQSQSMTVEAHAFSHGAEVTASVGPFTWSANNFSVVSLVPLVDSAYNFATNRATAKAVTPGITQIYATASGVASNSFRQPNLVPSPPLIFDFFETCPIQNIALELGHAGSEQTSFAVSKGTSQTVIATVTDVMGNSSLPNGNNAITLTKIPLTWTASQPTVVTAGSGCTQSCAVSTPTSGGGSVTATCTPPSCNVGFPLVPAALSPGSLSACAAYIHSRSPQVTSCEPFIPQPVYASPLPLKTTAAISGLVTGTGTTSPTSILATSQGCANEPPATCTTGIYNFSTAKAATNSANGMPVSPNSLLFNLGGDKVYVGSDFGAQLLNPANLGTQTGAFTPLGTVTGRVLAISNNGAVAVFSDTIHTPNQVYVVNSSSPASSTTTALDIAGASVAAFSPDGLKTFIFGFDTNGLPNLYVYSTLQALQVIPLPPQTSVNSIVFSTNGAFAYVVEPSLNGGGPAFSVYNTCDNQLYTDTITGQHHVPLAATPIAFKALPDGEHFIALERDGTLESFTSSITGIPAATLTKAATALCPMTVGHSLAQRIDLGQGVIHPVNFFVSGDGTLIYVAASDRSSILVYNSTTGAVSGIQLIGTTNPTPVSADISADGGTILIAGSDGMFHQVSTAFGGSDMVQLSFPDLANYQNPFCTFTPASGPCTLDFIAAKP